MNTQKLLEEALEKIDLEKHFRELLKSRRHAEAGEFFEIQVEGENKSNDVPEVMSTLDIYADYMKEEPKK
jgi:hypothetical protein